MILCVTEFFKSVFQTVPKFYMCSWQGIYNSFLFLAEFGLHCYARAFSSCGERGLLFVAVPGLLIAVASLVVEHRL